MTDDHVERGHMLLFQSGAHQRFRLCMNTAKSRLQAYSCFVQYIKYCMDKSQLIPFLSPDQQGSIFMKQHCR